MENYLKETVLSKELIADVEQALAENRLTAANVAALIAMYNTQKARVAALPKTITVIVQEPLCSTLDLPMCTFEMNPGYTLRLRWGDTESVYVFHLESNTNTLLVNEEKPGIHDLPRPEPTQ